MTLHSQLCLAVAMMADPDCKNPRARLREIKRQLAGEKIDKLRLAQVCLDELERETLSEPKRDLWRKQTRRLAREKKRRGKR